MKLECLKIIGTAHVSSDSVDEVRNTIIEYEPEVVAIELDYGRYKKMLEEESGEVEDEKISVKKILKSNNIMLFAITAILTYMQKHIGEDVGVKPGSEMLSAIHAAEEIDAKIALIDRDINITLKRALDSLSFFDKIKYIVTLSYELIFGDEDEIDDIESLKQEENVQEVMEMFKDASPTTYAALVHERDAFMSHKLLNIPEDKVVAVVGAGHKPGITKYLNNPEELPNINELVKLKEPGFPWGKLIGYTILILFVALFVVGFLMNANVGNNLIEFIVLTGGCSAIGSLLFGSKLPSAIVAFCVAPITILHPLLAAGWFAGLAEAKFRHVSRSDIRGITEVESLRELWNNNLFRILMVVVGANLGCTIGGLLSVYQVIIPLIHSIF